MRIRWRYAAWFLAILIPFCADARTDESLPPEMQTAIDQGVPRILAQTGAPSVSIAVVRDGKIALNRAYGLARLESKTAATREMRYSIGSVSKQFTATAILLLAEDGKLSLDDKVSRWIPTLTRAGDVSIRQLLSMTAGYQDYWPQDYVFTRMLEPIAGEKILELWARKPLDFEPGTRWQYSNTNYIAAGMIIEKASGLGLVAFLRKRIFEPLKMTSVFDTDQSALPTEDAAGYLRYALGPLRPAPKEGPGWLFAAGELAMTAHDLALWDISIIGQTILKPESYRLMQTEMRLADGGPTQYGLGVRISSTNGHRTVSHSGEVSGFSANNTIYPDDRAAVVVLCNFDATTATGDITAPISRMLLSPPPDSRGADKPPADAVKQVRKIVEDFQRGQIDRAIFTDNANAYFSEQAVKDFAASFGPLGTIKDVTGDSQSLRGGMTARHYTIHFEKKSIRAWTFTTPDGKLEQFMASETPG